MIIKSLRLQDFRLFRGVHEIDLEPRIKFGQRAPIVLFGGLNGNGKTSILMAIKLVLYGKHANGAPIGKRRYEELLRSYVHRAPNLLIQPNSSSIEIKFEFAKCKEEKE